MPSKSFTQLFKNARKEARHNQDSLAKKVGVSRSTIASLEHDYPPEGTLKKIFKEFPEDTRAELWAEVEERQRQDGSRTSPLLADGTSEDMIFSLAALRRSTEIDISGSWTAVWRTVVRGEENRNHETIEVKRRMNGSWQFLNTAVSEENPDGGYLWVGRMELFDNQHLLGYYVARDRSNMAKGTLRLLVQTNGNEIIGTWEGLNFDSMWAHGLVAMSRDGKRGKTSDELLEEFIKTKPKMPYAEIYPEEG